MNCPACGRHNRTDAAFCDSCGASLAHLCQRCGAELRADAKFCDSCGHRLGAEDVRSRTPDHLVQKILIERTKIEGERRTVTVLFADAKGFTPFSETRDAEQVYTFVQRCIERMIAGVHRYEGTVTQFTGDGIVALFGAPIAHEDSSRRAVAAALDIQAALRQYIEEAGIDTAFRIGLNTGPVVVGRVSDDLEMDYTAVGDTVNLAARMEQMAEPGTVNLTENTYREIADYFDCLDLGRLDVKGKAEPVHVYRAVRERPVRTRIDAAVARGLSPFVGRERDVEVLHGLWKEAVAGRGQIVLISGEPGIGKSRLLLEFHRSLGEDVIWREAHCVSYGENIPYLPVVELVKNGFGIGEGDDEGTIIQRVDDDIADWTPEGQKTVPYLKFLLQVDPGDAAIEHMDPMERRAGILDALRALILERARVAPRVVVVEDLHWADDQSEEAFRVCADVVATSPVLMILTFRPGYLHPSADMPHAHRIFLGNLDETARQALANATLEASHLSSNLAAPVTQKAEGNPLFIEEVTKALAAGATDADAVPNSLQDVILARIDRLEAEARGALQLASVIGREFTLRLLNRISDLQTELEGVLGELKSLELIYEKSFFPELAYMFKHALTHDVAYSTLLVERRKVLHRIVAIAIEELYEDRLAEHYETLAHHYVQAEEWRKALEYLEKAGDKASAAFATEEALRFYGQAIEICDQFGDSHLALSASMAERRSFICFRMGRLDEALDGFQRMVRAAQVTGDGYAEGLAWGYTAFANMYNHDLDAAAVSAQRAMDVGGAHDDVRFIALAASWCCALFNHRFDEFRSMYAEMEELASRVIHPWARGTWGWERVIFDQWDARYDDAVAMFESLRAYRDESGDISSVLWGRWALGLARGHRGEYEAALDIFLDVVDDGARVGDMLIYMRALNSVGWVYGELQDLDRAMQWNVRGFEEAVAAGFPDPEIEGNAALNIGDVHLVRGELDAAEERYAWVEKIYRNPRPQDIFMLWRYSQHMLHSYGELWLRRGDLDKAKSYADECYELASAAGSRKNVVKSLRLRGQVLAARDELDEAEGEITHGLEVAREIGNPGQLWKTWNALGDVRAARGESAAASDAYREAQKVVDNVASGLRDEELRKTFIESAEVSSIRAKAR
jgi:class 3 adenylate cyclase/tetratricopeptide (TPR) repeat protein